MAGMYADNDGRFPDDGPVMVKYPLPSERQQDRADWPWLPGTVLGQCGPDEWHVVVDGAEELAEPSDDDPDVLLYPACFRDSSEIRRQVSDSPSPGGVTRCACQTS
jgi:hypothetical protein